MNGTAKNLSAPQDTAADFHLRSATKDDFEFARQLYMSSMEVWLTALDAWDANKAETAFRSYFIEEEIEIVQLAGEDVGWLQISETEKELCLDQLHLVERARGQGIGTALLNKVIKSAAAKGKDVSLSLIKGNMAISLYERIGFRVIGEDDTKFHMRHSIGTQSTE